MPHFPLDKFPISPDDKNRLEALYTLFSNGAKKHLGYPGNLAYDYSDLYRFFEFTINNVGDPYVEGIYKIHSHEFEREVLSFFAKLFHLPEGEQWGYVTHGGTEGNFYALFLARQKFPRGKIYYSTSAHYSLPKAARLMCFRPALVPTQVNGEMDYDELYNLLVAYKGRPPIIVATTGTTMEGAIDRIDRILLMLEKAHIKEFYIHADAALSGMILPFLDEAPVFDFRLPIESISVSGHKMIGSPVPSGVVLTHKKNLDNVAKGTEITGSPDTTLSGSRNGHSALFLWYAIKRFGESGFRQMVQHSFRVKSYAEKKFREAGIEFHAEPHSIILVFLKPSDSIVHKWQLAVDDTIAHIVITPNVTEEHIDGLVHDLKSA